MRDIATEKDALRRDAKRTRADAHATHPKAGGLLVDRMRQTALVPTWQGIAVSSYLPIGSELDTLPLIHWLQDVGAIHGLPVVTAEGAPLTFRQWRPGDPLIDGGFATKCPDGAAPALEPAIILVPLLAFDRAGYRLGYGGGFYDRTLAARRSAGTITAIGLAFSAQEVDTVPRDEHDQPLDAVLTENGIVRPD